MSSDLKPIKMNMRQKNSIAFLFTLFVLESLTMTAAPSTKTLFDDNWLFDSGDPANAKAISFNDNSWRTVCLPHDWDVGPADILMAFPRSLSMLLNMYTRPTTRISIDVFSVNIIQSRYISALGL